MSKPTTESADDRISRMKAKQALSNLKGLVTHVPMLSGEVDAPIPAAKQADYEGAKTTHEYYVQRALNDPDSARECYQILEKELQVESCHR